jgi:hypothetical protein
MSRTPERIASAVEAMIYPSGLGIYEGFRLMVDFLLSKLAHDGDDTEAAEAAVKRFRHDPLRALEALRGVVKLYEDAVVAEPFTDILGSTYMLLGSKVGKQQMGQFFTPSSISRFMARLNMADEPASDAPFLKGLEPACGGGAMILAAAEFLAEQGDSRKPLVWLAVDLDHLCACMASVQLAAHRIPAVVVCGNSLTWGGSETARLVWPPLLDWPEITHSQAHALMDFLGAEATAARARRGQAAITDGEDGEKAV